MKCLLALSAAALLAAPSSPDLHGKYFTGMPPDRFRSDAILLVAYVTDIGRACGQQPGEIIYACAREVDGHVVLVLPNPCTHGDFEWSARLACHEKAHALGWGAEHEAT